MVLPLWREMLQACRRFRIELSASTLPFSEDTLALNICHDGPLLCKKHERVPPMPRKIFLWGTLVAPLSKSYFVQVINFLFYFLRSKVNNTLSNNMPYRVYLSGIIKTYTAVHAICTPSIRNTTSVAYMISDNVLIGRKHTRVYFNCFKQKQTNMRKAAMIAIWKAVAADKISSTLQKIYHCLLQCLVDALKALLSIVFPD